jgi:Zn-dependent peptidase ImmA (M78 family)
LGVEPLSNGRLEGLIGVAGSAAGSQRQGGSLSFLLGEQKTSYIVLASNFETGRRFQLARLLGDRLTAPGDSHLRLATHAATYRQKMQRSFAAELLCPFDALTDKVGNDFSAESLEDAAHHFNVSERTVRTLLVNHGCLDREDLDWDFERMSAA